MWHFSRIVCRTLRHCLPCAVTKLHYRVTYFHKRINLDFCHAIADGNGVIEFLNLIVYHYLKLKYPGMLPDLTMTSGASEADLSEDSFRQYYSKKQKSIKKKKYKRAYHIKGSKLPYNQIRFMEVQMDVKAILQKAKENKVSLTSYIASKLMMSNIRICPFLREVSRLQSVCRLI